MYVCIYNKKDFFNTIFAIHSFTIITLFYFFILFSFNFCIPFLSIEAIFIVLLSNLEKMLKKEKKKKNSELRKFACLSI